MVYLLEILVFFFHRRQFLVLFLHIVLFQGGVMTALFPQSVLCGLCAVAFISINRTLVRANMFQPIGIWNIGRGCGHLVDQARLHVDRSMLLVAVPELVRALGTKTRLLVSGDLAGCFVINPHFPNDHAFN